MYLKASIALWWQRFPGTKHQTFPEWSKTEFFQPPLNSKLFSFIFLSLPLPVPVLGSCECKKSPVVLLPSAQKKLRCAIAALSYVLQLISVRRNKIRKKKIDISKIVFFFLSLGSKKKWFHSLGLVSGRQNPNRVNPLQMWGDVFLFPMHKISPSPS